MEPWQAEPDPDSNFEVQSEISWSPDSAISPSWFLPADASGHSLHGGGLQQQNSFSVDDMMLDVFSADTHTNNDMEWMSTRSESDAGASDLQIQRSARIQRPKSFADMQFKFPAGRKAYIASQTGEAWELHKAELKSAKMYKTRFKQWGFVKNNNREDVSKMMLLRQRRAAVGKQTTFERNGKVVQIDRYLKKRGIIVLQQNTPVWQNELPGTVRCRTPPPPSAPELFSTTPGLLSLKELLMRCLKDLMPSFANLRDSTYVRYKATTSLWDSPRYLKLACNLFSEKRHKQAGSICDSAFSSVHALVQPPRLDTLFNFLVSQLWWNNKDVTLELWRYLAAYMASVLGATGSAVYHLLRGLVTHIESNGYGAYLDFVTECIDDVLRLDGSDQTKPRFCWKGENQLVGWCQLIVMDCYFTNGYNSRADRIQARCASALPRSRIFPRDRELNERMWRNTFDMSASSSSFTLPVTQSSRHDRFLRLAFASYAKVFGQAAGSPIMHPSLTRIEAVVGGLSRRGFDTTAFPKRRRSLDLESRILSFLTRDLAQGVGQPVDYGSYPV
ncbi:hypothetical protein LQW54_008731 [Pestalotiopsis sp. IQ-011]